MFFQLIIAMLMGLGCPSTSNNTNQDGTVTTQDGPTLGGDHGQTPPPKIN